MGTWGNHLGLGAQIRLDRLGLDWLMACIGLDWLGLDCIVSDFIGFGLGGICLGWTGLDEIGLTCIGLD